MKKAVLLVRVSTSYQDYEDQTNDLIAFAKRDGYTESELEIIQNKESGTKLSDEERQGLTEMYAAIKKPDNKIDCVYVWELSRLSRNPDTLYKIKGELVKRKINLKIWHEKIVMLDNAKEQIPNSELYFGLFVTLCQNEMQSKTARFKRAKRGKAIRGGFNGGKPKYGYIPNSDTKNYEIHQEQSEIVKLLFELYSTGKYGLAKLHAEVLKQGKNINIKMIGDILRSRDYTGETMPEKQYSKKIKGKEISVTRYARIYPPIISTELFEKCRKVASKNNTNVDKSHNIYFANKLIKCNGCGSNLVASKTNAVYRCINPYNSVTKTECKCNDCININVMDSILWNTAVIMESIYRSTSNKKRIIKWKKEIKELQTKVDNSDKQYKIIVSNKIKGIRNICLISRKRKRKNFLPMIQRQ